MAKKHIGTWNGVPVYTDFLPIGTRRAGDKLTGPKFIVAHDTGNPNTTAQNNVDYYKNTYNIDWNATASAHIFVDDKECIICVPLDEKAWHVMYNTPTDNKWYGIDANDGAIGVEGSYFTDRTRSLKSFDNYCRILAYLCKTEKINPETNMPGHQDIQADKQDPGNLLAACGMSRSVSNIDKKVLAYMKSGATTSTAKKADTVKKTDTNKATPKPAKTSSSTSTTWKRNASGILWKTEKATFKCGVTVGIVSRKGGPWTGWPQGPLLKKGQSIKYDEIQDFDGYIWVSGKLNGQYVYVPVGKSNSNGKRVGPAWGTFS